LSVACGVAATHEDEPHTRYFMAGPATADGQADSGRLAAVKRLLYVSGPPGAGKTSLAVPLAAELGYALLTKDTIKETRPVGVGDLITVDTTGPVNVTAVAAQVRRHHGAG
jgi:hypothetical protein